MSDTWEEYFVDNTDVLKNRLNINDKSILEKEEKNITLKKLIELQFKPIEGEFDIVHLKKIHKYLFEEIYFFAGEFRTCTLGKTTRNFYDPDMIIDELNKELKELNESFYNMTINYKNSTYMDDSLLYEYANILSNAYYQLMTIHPFREGNGRSVREFLREFVESKNKFLSFELELDYSKMDKESALKGVEYKFIYPSMLMLEFKKALVARTKSKII